MDAFGKIDGVFALEVLKTSPMPENILTLGEAGLREIWHEAKLRGRGYGKAKEIVEYAGKSVGLKERPCVNSSGIAPLNHQYHCW